jgi:hypothetical protein
MSTSAAAAAAVPLLNAAAKALVFSAYRGGSKFPSVVLRPAEDRLMRMRRGAVPRAALLPSSYEFAAMNLSPGDTVEVRSAEQTLLGYGLLDTHGQRVLPYEFLAADAVEVPNIGQLFWEHRFGCAAAARARLLPPATTAYRLVHAGADGVPATAVDVYNKACVVTTFSTAALPIVPVLHRYLAREHGAHDVFFRSPQSFGLHKLVTVMDTTFQENGVSYDVLLAAPERMLNLRHRAVRRFVRDRCARRHVLCLGGRQGGFAVNALLGSAQRVVVWEPRQVRAADIDAAVRRNFDRWTADKLSWEVVSGVAASAGDEGATSAGGDEGGAAPKELLPGASTTTAAGGDGRQLFDAVLLEGDGEVLRSAAQWAAALDAVAPLLADGAIVVLAEADRLAVPGVVPDGGGPAIGASVADVANDFAGRHTGLAVAQIRQFDASVDYPHAPQSAALPKVSSVVLHVRRGAW